MCEIIVSIEDRISTRLPQVPQGFGDLHAKAKYGEQRNFGPRHDITRLTRTVGPPIVACRTFMPTPYRSIPDTYIYYIYSKRGCMGLRIYAVVDLYGVCVCVCVALSSNQVSVCLDAFPFMVSYLLVCIRASFESPKI